LNEGTPRFSSRPVGTTRRSVFFLKCCSHLLKGEPILPRVFPLILAGPSCAFFFRRLPACKSSCSFFQPQRSNPTHRISPAGIHPLILLCRIDHLLHLPSRRFTPFLFDFPFPLLKVSPHFRDSARLFVSSPFLRCPSLPSILFFPTFCASFLCYCSIAYSLTF